MNLRSILPAICLAAAIPASAQHITDNVLLNLHVGAAIPQDTKKFDTSYGAAYGKLNTGVDFGVNIQILHGERFSTRWGYGAIFQKVSANSGPSYDRPSTGFYAQGLFNVMNGVGKSWYVLAGGVYLNRKIETDDSITLDESRKGGFQVGTGVNFNAGKWRFSPEVIYQKVGEDGTLIARFNIGL